MCANDTRAKLIVFKGDNNKEREKCGEIMASKEMSFDATEAEKEPRKMALDERVLLKKGTKYTLELDQYGGSTHYCGSAEKEVSLKGVSVTFSNACFSPNGTDSSMGQLPCLYFSKV